MGMDVQGVTEPGFCSDFWQHVFSLACKMESCSVV